MILRSSRAENTKIINTKSSIYIIPMVRYVEIDLEQWDCPYVNSSEDFSEGEIYVHRWEVTKNRLKTRGVVYSKDYDVSALIERLVKDKNNLEFSFVAGGKDFTMFNGAIKLTDAMKILSHYGYIVGPFTIRKGREIWRIEFDNAEKKESALSELEKHHSFKVLCDKKLNSRDILSTVLLESLIKRDSISLTPAEKKAVESAYRSGYFDVPKKRTSDEIAKTLGISKTAFCKNLSKGERKLIGLFIGNAD